MKILIKSIFCLLALITNKFTSHYTQYSLKTASITHKIHAHAQKSHLKHHLGQQVSSSACTSRLHLKDPFDQLLSPAFDVRSSFLVSKKGRD